MIKNNLAKNMFGLGQANTAFAQYFIGNSYLNPLTRPGEMHRGFLANVTFEPGCRNNWHIHHAKSGGGQILICTAGEGWYQEAGKDAVSLTPGTVIVISRGGQALARGQGGQLVLPHRRGGARRGDYATSGCEAGGGCGLQRAWSKELEFLMLDNADTKQRRAKKDQGCDADGAFRPACPHLHPEGCSARPAGRRQGVRKSLPPESSAGKCLLWR